MTRLSFLLFITSVVVDVEGKTLMRRVDNNNKLVSREVRGEDKSALREEKEKSEAALEAGIWKEEKSRPQVYHPHEPKISPFFRYAHYNCQDKGAMLEAFPDKSVLEIGAHDGEEWQQFKNATHFWTVEPSPDKEQRLREAESKFKAASPETSFERFRMAVSSKTGVMKFWVDGKNSEQNTLERPPPWVTQREFDMKAITVNVTTLDDLWKEQLHQKHITMLKSDTQGHEPAIIMSGKELFEKDPPEIVHVEYSPGLIAAADLKGQDMLEFLYGYGYLCFDCDKFQPPPLDADKRDIKTYHEYFGEWKFKGGEHGKWTDLVCLH